MAKQPSPPPNRIGKPLGNHANSKMSGYYKIKLKNLGYRVVYQLVMAGKIMKIIVISVRDNEEVYKEAEMNTWQGDISGLKVIGQYKFWL